MRQQRNKMKTSKRIEDNLSEKNSENGTRITQHLGKRKNAQVQKSQEMFNKELEVIRSKQTRKNNKITEVKNKLEGINSRITEAQE